MISTNIKTIIKMMVFCSILYANNTIAQNNVHYSASPKQLNKSLDQWFFGEITLKSGMTIETDFAINPMVEGGLLKVKDGKKLVVLTCRDLSSFSFYDKRKNVNRNFEIIEENPDHPFMVEIIYEYEDYRLLGLPLIEIYQIIYIETGTSFSAARNKSLVFLEKENELIKFNRRILWRLAGEYKDLLKKYMFDNNLKIKNPIDAKGILSYLEYIKVQDDR